MSYTFSSVIRGFTIFLVIELRYFFFSFLMFSFGFLDSRNLSNLNLGGEISPAIGDLKNLQSMYVFFFFIYLISSVVGVTLAC